MDLYISGYTKKDSKGVYYVEFDGNKFTNPKLVLEADNPTYMEYDKKNNIIYILDKDHTNEKYCISSYKIKLDNSLEHIDTSYSLTNTSACHLALDFENQNIYTSSYHDSLFEQRKFNPINGMITKPTNIFYGDGSGPISDRQEKSHIHMVYPNGTFIYSCDLGSDTIYVIDIRNGECIQKFKTNPGSGPRHMTIVNNIAYIVTELSNEIIWCKVDEVTGELTFIGSLFLLPRTFDGNSQASAILYNPDTNCIYTANRGYNHINVFKINDDGSLENIQNIYSGGHWCRDFYISPDSKYLFTCHERTYELCAFLIDNKGMLTKLESETKVPEATCIRVV